MSRGEPSCPLRNPHVTMSRGEPSGPLPQSPKRLRGRTKQGEESAAVEKIKYSRGSGTQISSGTASGLGCRPIFRWEGAGGFPVVNLRATGVPEGNRGFGGRRGTRHEGWPGVPRRVERWGFTGGRPPNSVGSADTLLKTAKLSLRRLYLFKL